MSLYSKRVSELELEGVEAVTDDRGNTRIEAGRDFTVVAGDKRLRVSLSKDGQSLEIEYLVKSGIRKPETVMRMSL